MVALDKDQTGNKYLLSHDYLYKYICTQYVELLELKIISYYYTLRIFVVEQCELKKCSSTLNVKISNITHRLSPFKPGIDTCWHFHCFLFKQEVTLQFVKPTTPTKLKYDIGNDGTTEEIWRHLITNVSQFI